MLSGNFRSGRRKPMQACQRGARLLRQQGRAHRLIKLYGSMELAPLVGLPDVIVDLVSTGGTLKASVAAGDRTGMLPLP